MPLLTTLLLGLPLAGAAAEKPVARPAAGSASTEQGGLTVGDVAPTQAQLRNLAGKVVDLGMLCGPLAARFNPHRPKAVLADFYMTSCAPCNAALPALARIAERGRERGLRTLLVSLDGTEHAAGGHGLANAELKTKVAPAGLQDDDVVRDPGRVLAEDFGIIVRTAGGSTVGVPRTFLLDDRCIVRGVYTDLIGSREELERRIDELVGPPRAGQAAGREAGQPTGSR